MKPHAGVRIVLLAWVIGIVVVSLVPSGGISMWNLDKLGHLLAYAGLSLLACLAFEGTRARWLLLLGAVALGAALELAQQFVPGRDMSLVDGVVNAAGVLAGAVVFRRFGDEVRHLSARVLVGPKPPSAE